MDVGGNIKKSIWWTLPLIHHNRWFSKQFSSCRNSSEKVFSAHLSSSLIPACTSCTPPRWTIAWNELIVRKAVTPSMLFILHGRKSILTVRRLKWPASFKILWLMTTFVNRWQFLTLSDCNGHHWSDDRVKSRTVRPRWPVYLTFFYPFNSTILRQFLPLSDCSGE